MANNRKIKLSAGGGFTPVPEGIAIFEVSAVDYKPDFGKLEITCTTYNGLNHIERFSLLDSNGNMNPKAQNAFSAFAKTILQDWKLEEIDPEDLIGGYFKARVTHKVVPSTKNEGESVTFVNTTDWRPADEFAEDTVSEKPTGGLALERFLKRND